MDLLKICVSSFVWYLTKPAALFQDFCLFIIELQKLFLGYKFISRYMVINYFSQPVACLFIFKVDLR